MEVLAPPWSTKAPERELLSIELVKVRPNPRNPRGQDIEVSDTKLEDLKASIAAFGILVPLVVRELRDGTYELINGERRFYAARQLRLPEVPAYVFKSEMSEELIRSTMFHIHTLQVQWGPIEQCAALEPVYRRLVDQYGEEDTNSIVKDLVDLTALNRRTARNRVQFLRWPDSIKNELYANPNDPEKPYWYVVEIEDKIIEPARRNYPEYFDDVPVDEVRELLYRKQLEAIQKSTGPRLVQKIVESDTSGGDRDLIRSIFGRLVKDPAYSYKQASDEYLDVFPYAEEPVKLATPRKLLRQTRELTEQLEAYDPSYVFDYRGPWSADPDDLIEALAQLEQLAGDLREQIEGQQK